MGVMVRRALSRSRRLELSFGAAIGILGLAGCPLSDDYVISSSSGVAGDDTMSGAGGGDAGPGGAGGGMGPGGPGVGGAGGIDACGPDPEPPGGLPCPPQCSLC